MKMIFQTHRTRIAAFAFLCFMLSAPVLSYARDVSFIWTANPEPVIGYKLYYKAGTDSAQAFQGTGLTQGDAAPIVLGNVTTYTVTGLSPDEKYSFVLTAFNDIQESAYSEIITVEPSSSPTPTIINISIRK
jgi:hypothetical protein